jgi:hypothetical protein
MCRFGISGDVESRLGRLVIIFGFDEDLLRFESESALEAFVDDA